MSHYDGFETTITNQEALIRALCRCENRRNEVIKRDWLEVHEKAAHLVGYQNDTRAQTANIILRRKHVGGAANDVGFIKTADGTYQAIISEYDSGHYDKPWLTKLFTYYNVECSKMAFEDKGIECVEDTDEAGRIRLRAKFLPTNASRIKTHS